MIFPGLSMFKTPKPPVQELPPIAPPAVMPVPDDDQAKAAARRKNAARRRRSGRLSTINTGVEAKSTLGG